MVGKGAGHLCPPKVSHPPVSGHLSHLDGTVQVLSWRLHHAGLISYQLSRQLFCFSWTVIQRAPMILISARVSAGVTGIGKTMSGLCGCWDLNDGPHNCQASALTS